jgi:tetratricopeptide (TPR) repeat protein
VSSSTDRHDADVAPGTLPPPASPLEEEREFLLRSLEDLEREHAAGDVDDDDYAALKDDYTARAAAVIRAIDAGRKRPRKQPRAKDRRRTLLVAAGVVVFAALAGVLVAQSIGRRDPGEVTTGDISQSLPEKLNEAGRRSGEGQLAAAIELYDEVLAEDPDNAEAMTYRGWVQFLDGDQGGGLSALIEAATAHPDYADVHAFLAVVLFRNGLVPQAARELDRLDALDPPAAIRQLTDGLRTQIDAALASTTTTATTTAP